MASGEKKLSVMNHITSAPDNAKLYVVLPDGSYGYIEKSELLAGVSGGRTVLKIDAETETYTTVEIDKKRIIWIPLSAASLYQITIDDIYSVGDTILIYSENNGVLLKLPDGGSVYLPDFSSEKTLDTGQLIMVTLLENTPDNVYSYNIVPFEIPTIPTINEHYKGTYTSLSALETAHPTASLGDYAIVDAGAGNDAIQYIWDAQEGWVAAGTSSLTTTDSLTEGTINLYFTVARVLASALTGLSLSDGSDVTSANSILVAIGKLQKQLTDVRASKQDNRSWLSQSSTRFLDNTTALQKIFNVGSSGNGSMAITSGRKYRVKGWAVFSALSGSSKNVSFGVLGTATASYVSGIAQGLISSAVSTPGLQALTSFSQTQIASNSAITSGKIHFDFEFNCNGSGTFIPGVAFSAAVANMQVDSAYCEITDIGSSSLTSTSNIV